MKQPSQDLVIHYPLKILPWKQKLTNFIFSLFGITEQDEQPTCEVYLKVLLHVLATFQLVPFRIEMEGTAFNHNSYSLRSRKCLSKVFCIFIQIGALVTGFWNAYDVTNVTGAVATLLSIVSFLSEFSITILTCQLLWCRRNLVTDLLNVLAKYPIPRPGKYWKIKVCAVVVIILCISFIQGYLSVFQAEVINKLASGAVKIVKEVVYKSDNNAAVDYIFNILHKVLATWFYLALRLTFLFEMKVVVIIVFVLKLAGDTFLSVAKETKSVDMLMHQLDNLKTLNSRITRFCGNICFLLFILTISNYAVTPAFLRSNKIDWCKYWYRIITMLVHAFTWICAAETHRKVQMYLRYWVRKKKLDDHLTQSDYVKLNLLAKEIESDPVGVGCCHFVVSYTLLTSLVGLLATYTGIALQSY